MCVSHSARPRRHCDSESRAWRGRGSVTGRHQRMLHGSMSSFSAARNVAVIGAGAMGSRIAWRLLAAGHRVIVWNRTPEKLASLVQAGALPAATPEQAAQKADVVVTMVTDPAALRAVSEGRDGIAAGIGDATLIEMSTVGTAAVKRLARA